MATKLTIALLQIGEMDPRAQALSRIQAQIAGAREQGAQLICLPQLSFTGYFPAQRDRGALELAQRAEAEDFAAALRAADGAWLAASSYESEGEGVFYFTARLAAAKTAQAWSYRQRRLESEPERYEAMFASPGHEPLICAPLPWGSTGYLIGADVRELDNYAALTGAGAKLVLGGVSENAEGWRRTRQLISAMAATHGLWIALVNRAGFDTGTDFAGGTIVATPNGVELEGNASDIYELEL